MKGAPLRMETGPRDVQQGNVVLARRDTGEKQVLAKNEAVEKIPYLLENIQQGLFDQALKFREENTHNIESYDEFKKVIKKGGFVRCGWDGTEKTETRVKEETKATIRCIPFDENPSDWPVSFQGSRPNMRSFTPKRTDIFSHPCFLSSYEEMINGVVNIK